MTSTIRPKEFIDPDPPTFSFGWHALSLVLSYTFALFAVSLLSYAVMGPMAFFVFSAGLTAGLPSLGLSLTALFFFKDKVELNPERWCAAAPFAVALLCLPLDLIFANAPASVESVWYGRTFIAFIATALSANFYYRMFSDSLRRANHARLKEFLENEEEKEKEREEEDRKRYIQKLRSKAATDSQ